MPWKSGRGPARQACIVLLASVYIGFNTTVPLKSHPGRMLSVVWKSKNERSSPGRTHNPDRPSPPRPAQPGQARTILGPAQHRLAQGYVRVLDPTNSDLAREKAAILQSSNGNIRAPNSPQKAPEPHSKCWPCPCILFSIGLRCACL